MCTPVQVIKPWLNKEFVYLKAIPEVVNLFRQHATSLKSSRGMILCHLESVLCCWIGVSRCLKDCSAFIFKGSGVHEMWGNT